MRPRILFVDHVGVLGGGELSLLDIAEHYKERGRVALFAEGPFRERLEQRGIKVEVLPASSAVNAVSREGGIISDLIALPAVLALTWKLARLARACDILYANSQKSMIVAGLAGFLARKPVVWHLRDVMSSDHFSAAHRWVTSVCANLFIVRVIANSRSTKEAIVANGVHPGRVHVVYNGIDERTFDAVKSGEVKQLRDDLQLNGAPVIGLFSRLTHWKGQHVLIEALQELPEVHAVLVGEALFQEDNRYAVFLRTEAERSGVADRVHFLGFREDIPQLLKAVDIVVHTSISPEPFGRVIVEGMMAGKPVVAAGAGGAAEILSDGQTGLLAPPGDARALAGAISKLLGDVPAAQRMARAGQEAARKRFSLQAMLERLDGHLKAIAQK